MPWLSKATALKINAIAMYKCHCGGTTISVFANQLAGTNKNTAVKSNTSSHALGCVIQPNTCLKKSHIYFFRCFAHLARCAALIFANPAAEIRRLRVGLEPSPDAPFS